MLQFLGYSLAGLGFVLGLTCTIAFFLSAHSRRQLRKHAPDRVADNDVWLFEVSRRADVAAAHAGLPTSAAAAPSPANLAHFSGSPK
jgi:multisubunit Na+/H+ antiporter MnhB subunit